MPRRMFEFEERADDGVTGAFYLKSVPYTDRRGRSHVKMVPHVEITTEREVRVPTKAAEVQLDRAVTEDDKTRWPNAWAAFEQQRREAEE